MNQVIKKRINKIIEVNIAARMKTQINSLYFVIVGLFSLSLIEVELKIEKNTNCWQNLSSWKCSWSRGKFDVKGHNRMDSKNVRRSWRVVDSKKQFVVFYLMKCIHFKISGIFNVVVQFRHWNVEFSQSMRPHFTPFWWSITVSAYSRRIRCYQKMCWQTSKMEVL